MTVSLEKKLVVSTGVFRTLSNIKDGAFAKNFPSTNFAKKL